MVVELKELSMTVSIRGYGAGRKKNFGTRFCFERLGAMIYRPQRSPVASAHEASEDGYMIAQKGRTKTVKKFLRGNAKLRF